MPATTKGVQFEADIIEHDFIASAVDWLAPHPLFATRSIAFDCAILNPPYRKINSDSETRGLLREAGIETSNLYTAFLWLVLKLLGPKGELVAITPRSFCNGPYFRPFREALLAEAHISRGHVFESRKMAFRDDDVLQENIIFRAVKSPLPHGPTVISTSRGPDDPDITLREVGYQDLVPDNDPGQVIHLAPDELQGRWPVASGALPHRSSDLGVQVSTGRVVDFRAKEFLIHDHAQAGSNGKTAPLIYPTHFDNGSIVVAQGRQKAELLADCRRDKAVARAERCLRSGEAILGKGRETPGIGRHLQTGDSAESGLCVRESPQLFSRERNGIAAAPCKRSRSVPQLQPG